MHGNPDFTKDFLKCRSILRCNIPSSKLLKFLASMMKEVDDEMERLRQMQTIRGRLHTHELSLVETTPAT